MYVCGPDFCSSYSSYYKFSNLKDWKVNSSRHSLTGLRNKKPGSSGTGRFGKKIIMSFMDVALRTKYEAEICSDGVGGPPVILSEVPSKYTSNINKQTPAEGSRLEGYAHFVP